MNTLDTITTIVLIVLFVGMVLPLKASLISKGLITLAIIIGLSRNFVHLIYGGTAYDPDVPYNFIFILELTRASLFTLAIFVVITSAVNAVAMFKERDLKAFYIPTAKPFTSMIMLALAFAVGLYGTSCAYMKPELNHYEVTLDRLAPELDGMRVVVLTDVHITGNTDPNHFLNLIEVTNKLNPDLIFLVGDLIDGPLSKRHVLTRLFFDLRAKYGVFVTTGNHEYYADYPEWRKYFEKGGLISVDNKAMLLKDPKGKPLLSLGGITDPTARYFNLPTPDIKGVVSGLNDSVPTIALSHRPNYVNDFAKADKKVDLVLSGHTHGGLFPVMSYMSAKENGGYLAGAYRVNNTNLIVSRGIAVWATYPIRLGVDPEIVVLTLHSREPGDENTVNITRAAELRQKALQKRERELAKKKEQEQAKAGTLVLTAQEKSKAKAAEVDDEEESEELADDMYLLGTDGKMQGFRMILPMVNTESGEVDQSMTNLAVIPASISEEQLEQINAIINNEPIPHLNKKGDAPVKISHASKRNKINVLPTGYTWQVTYDQQVQAKLAEHAKAKDEAASNAAQNAQSLGHGGNASIGAPANNKASGAAQEQGEDASLDAQGHEGAPAPIGLNEHNLTDDQLYILEHAQQESTLEIQTEYGISLGSQENNIAPQGVSDLINTNQVRQPALPPDEQESNAK